MNTSLEQRQANLLNSSHSEVALPMHVTHEGDVVEMADEEQLLMGNFILNFRNFIIGNRLD